MYIAHVYIVYPYSVSKSGFLRQLYNIKTINKQSCYVLSNMYTSHCFWMFKTTTLPR